MLVHWLQRYWCSLLPSLGWPHVIYLGSWTYFPSSCAISFFTALDFTFTTRHIHNWASFLLWPSHFILTGAVGNWPTLFSSILDTFWPEGPHLLALCLFAFLYCPWRSLGKNTGLGCHLFQWTMFCQNSSLWPVLLGWPGTAWLIASLSYANPFLLARLWFMKGIHIWGS